MKNFTLIALASAMVGGMCQDAGAVPLPAVFKNVRARIAPQLKAEAKADAPLRYAAQAAEAAALWRAQTQKAFGWDGEEWVLTETYAISYDEQGQKTVQTVTDEDGYVNRETYTWNDNGQLATRFIQVDPRGNGEYEDYSRLRREYDSRLTSFITFNDQEICNNGSWAPSNNYKQTITRDDAGNVMQMERAVFFEGVYDPTYRINISYGDDGQANGIVVTELTYDYSTGEYAWVETERYTDIVWAETDGQIVGVEDDDDLFRGANRLKSANIEIDGQVLSLNVEYDGNNYVATAIVGEEGISVVTTIAYTELDFSTDYPLNKGWKVEMTYDFMMGSMSIGNESIVETYIYTADDLIVLDKLEVSENGGPSYIESMIEGAVEYDEENGCPVSWTVSEYIPEMDESFPSFRAEYSDYIDCSTSGIVNAMTADDTTAVYYNLQGRRVENPMAGIYIKVSGGKATKVIK